MAAVSREHLHVKANFIDPLGMLGFTMAYAALLTYAIYDIAS